MTVYQLNSFGEVTFLIGTKVHYLLLISNYILKLLLIKLFLAK